MGGRGLRFASVSRLGRFRPALDCDAGARRYPQLSCYICRRRAAAPTGRPLRQGGGDGWPARGLAKPELAYVHTTGAIPKVPWSRVGALVGQVVPFLGSWKVA